MYESWKGKSFLRVLCGETGGLLKFAAKEVASVPEIALREVAKTIDPTLIKKKK